MSGEPRFVLSGELRLALSGEPRFVLSGELRLALSGEPRLSRCRSVAQSDSVPLRKHVFVFKAFGKDDMILLDSRIDSFFARLRSRYIRDLTYIFYLVSVNDLSAISDIEQHFRSSLSVCRF